MEETIIKCDNCLDILSNKEIYIEVRIKDKRKVIDKKFHFCDLNCLMNRLEENKNNLTHQQESKGE